MCKKVIFESIIAESNQSPLRLLGYEEAKTAMWCFLSISFKKDGTKT